MIKLKHLKIFRRGLSLLMLIAIVAFFLGINRFYLSNIGDFFIGLQLIPLILNISAQALLVAIFLLFLIVLLTFLFGRVYCSTICPMGVLQDIFSFISLKSRKKKNRRFSFKSSRKRILKYSVLGLTALLWIFGSLFLLNILDPFSNFGKITTAFIQPLYIYLNNTLAFTLENYEIYTVQPIETKLILTNVVVASSVILLLIGFLSVWRGRLFCNTFCPTGAILSLISERSLFKTQIKEDECTLCGSCEKVCKAECIDSKEKSIDHGRCVSCFNCFASCTNNGFYYGFNKTIINKSRLEVSAKESIEDNNRRNFLLMLGAGLVSIPILKRGLVKGAGVHNKPGLVPTGTASPVSPPGSQSLKHFTKHCIACYLCVSKCPKNVIVPSFFEYGLGFMQPKLDFHRSYCNFDCVDCSQVCPTGAIKPQNIEDKKLIQIGVAKFFVESCIVSIDRTDCGACSEHCPTKAVNMVPYNGLWLPEVNPDLCIGCGACEYACPTYPYKAIYVEANTVHKQAIPIEDEGGPQEYKEEEFPF